MLKDKRFRHKRGELIDGVLATEHPLYATWANMHYRCSNETSVGYENYGGRGIKVCDRWNRFKFFVLDMGPKPSPEMTIERIENHLGYAPENCRWDTRSNQCVNRRVFKNNSSGHSGVVKTESSWVARFDYENVRYNIGWFATFDEAVRSRDAFVELFLCDRDVAIATLPKDSARNTSATKVRGVTKTSDGGYTVRITVEGVRHYVGYFASFDDACSARESFIKARDEAGVILDRDVDRACRNSRTGIKGVNCNRGAFVARATLRGKRVYIGKFTTLKEACDARQEFLGKQAV